MIRLGGYKGKLLRVNLNNKTWTEEKIKEEDLSKYIGGRTLGAYYLFNEVRPGVDPLSPNNKLMFFTGPLTGTMAPTSSRFCVSTLSPLTNIYLFSICSGVFGNKLKAAGYDALIIEGGAFKPLVLKIFQGQVEFIPADNLWGKDVFITQEILKKEYGSNGTIETACIGRGGENLSKMACIISGTRAAGRGGPGAVMGSKKLKAVIVGGQEKIFLARPEACYRTIKAMYHLVKETPFLKEGMRRYGSAISLGVTKKFGIIPCYNWRKTEFEGLEGLIPEIMRDSVIKDLACPTCPIGCSKVTLAKTGSFVGVMTEGPEYETLYSLGSICNIGSLDAVIAADNLCDRLGLDTISCGVTIAFAMECAEKGILPSPYSEFNLKFGDAKNMIRMIELIAHRNDGLGGMFSDGCLAASQLIGQGSDYFAMHAKGMELGGYDPRGVKAQSMVLACGPRGGCHHAGGYVITSEIKGPDRFAFKGKGKMVKDARDFRAFLDSAIYCAFLGIAVDLELGARLIADTTGLNFSGNDAIKLGDLCSCLERLYNNKAGIERTQDTLPPRILYEELPDGPSSGHKMIAELEIMKNELYQESGWDSNGKPTIKKLRELGLEKLL